MAVLHKNNRILQRFLTLIEPQNADIQAFRFEKKFILPTHELKHFEMRLAQFGCSTLYEPRWIHNIYADTFDYLHHFENVDGLSQRKKVRFRWYGDPQSHTSITAEIKIKSDDVNRKESMALGSFNLLECDDPNLLFQQIKARYLERDPSSHTWLHAYQPTLQNRYFRAYYSHPLEPIRITIDSPIHYTNIHTQISAIQEDMAIIELKAPSEHPLFSSLIPLQLHKSSKYVEGLSRTDPRYLR